MLTQFRIIQARGLVGETEIAELVPEYADPSSVGSKVVIANRNVFTKHRTEWTDATLRRKDARVHNDYVDKLFYSLHKNKLLIDMLKAIDGVIKTTPVDFAKTSIDYLVNRVKISFHDPSAKAGIGSLNYSFESIARMLNKLPLNRNWNAESAEKLIKYIKGTFAISLLGSTGALVNRTQVINPFIRYGYNAIKKSAKILSGDDPNFKKETVDAIIDFLGIDEVTNMMFDMASHSGDLSFADAALINTPIPFLSQIPTPALKDFMVMLRGGSKKFLKNGLPEIDKALLEIEAQRVRNIKNRKKALPEREQELKSLMKRGVKKAKFAALLRSLKAEQKRVRGTIREKNIVELRENFLDLLLTPKSDNSHKVLEAKIRKVMGEVTEDRMTKFVGWKLSFWFNGFGKEMFTFTGSEQYMRRQTAIMALMHAADAGLLGTYDPNELKEYKFLSSKTNAPVVAQVPSIFLTDAAKSVARNAVKDTMFGMSAIHNGDAFSGAGQIFFQFKAYSIQQMFHDWNILRSFLDSNISKVDAIKRLTDAVSKMRELSKAGITFDDVSNSKDIDTDAMSMVRLLGSRVSMSIFASIVESTKLLRFLIRSPLYAEVSTMVRGGENPVFGLAFRGLLNMILISMLDEDDWFEGNLLDLGWDFGRLFLPVFVTVPLYITSTFWDD